jgi:hypothetical protein
MDCHPERRCRIAGYQWDPIERAEAVVVEVVVVDDDQILVRELGHEVERLRVAKGADDRLPGAAVRVNRPDAPQPHVAQAL